METDKVKVEEWKQKERNLRVELNALSKEYYVLLKKMEEKQKQLKEVEEERLAYEKQNFVVVRTVREGHEPRMKGPTSLDRRLAKAAQDTLGIPYDEALAAVMGAK